MIKSWSELKYFKKDSKIDKWGNPDKMDSFLLLYLDEFRDAIGSPLIVTSGYRPGDPAQHGVGRAVDVIAPEYTGSLFDLYLLSERFNFGGIGIYRDWVYNGKKTGGLHLDTRLLVGSYKADELKGSRWLCVRPGAHALTDTSELLRIKQVYLALDHENLRREGII